VNLSNPHIRLAVVLNRERDLRAPSWARHEEFLRGKAAHRARRARECRKVAPAVDLGLSHGSDRQQVGLPVVGPPTVGPPIEFPLVGTL
jgi:hypothetical protein